MKNKTKSRIMDIQELWQFIYFLIFTVGTLFVGFLGVDFKVCHDCTRTWWETYFINSIISSGVKVRLDSDLLVIFLANIAGTISLPLANGNIEAFQ